VAARGSAHRSSAFPSIWWAILHDSRLEGITTAWGARLGGTEAAYPILATSRRRGVARSGGFTGVQAV
jgi:hypothetical protein